MKKVYSVLVALMATTMSFAQVTTIATLSHDGEVSSYYGTVALQEAYAAAADGDVITLSSGSFAAVDINKALTIRGAGMQEDTVTVTNPTRILGSFSINVPTTEEHRLTLEGIYHADSITIDTLVNATFVKNRLRRVTYKTSESSKMEQLVFIHCKITNRLMFPKTASASCVNCYIDGIQQVSNPTNGYEFLNCVIKQPYVANTSSNSIDISNYIYNSTFTNCIIAFGGDRDFYALNTTNTAYYCVGTYTNGSTPSSISSIFANMPNQTNTVAYIGSLFKTYKDSYSDTETFELTDEAKTKYLGQDGTEVGMYGGNLPYDPIPTNPKITKFDVAPKSTADGKLSVEIEVMAAE